MNRTRAPPEENTGTACLKISPPILLPVTAAHLFGFYTCASFFIKLRPISFELGPGF